MLRPDRHTFHIPVLGLGYSVDTPVKVARFGIDSVMSIIQDELLEKMREFHSRKYEMNFEAISRSMEDFRARRVTAYLDMIQEIVDAQMKKLRAMSFSPGSDIVKYFELLPEDSALKRLYVRMKMLQQGDKEKEYMQEVLRSGIVPGSIDVNIMSKLDNLGYDKDDNRLSPEFSDAVAALRGFAKSKLRSAIVFSAGYNPRLYSYAETIDEFYPDENNQLRKKIILKVSDYRSALVQGKIFAKKGLWVSEFRIESGLNCGGHAFATDGLLMGPILEEFKLKRAELSEELFVLCNEANRSKGKNILFSKPELRISAQGGIGTAREHQFLLNHYDIHSAGWGSPFLLVPEATNTDEATLSLLANARKEDYYLSNCSPLGIPLNNVRNTSAEKQINARIESGRPGSPCYQHYLASDTEFGERPICTASREYQFKKLGQLKERGLSTEEYQKEYSRITAKDCLCEGLVASAYVVNDLPLSHKLNSISICPGPNLAYFSGVFTLAEMVDHIYGRADILNKVPRSNMFVNELRMYIDYFKENLLADLDGGDAKKIKYANTFVANLISGISYYRNLVDQMTEEGAAYREKMKEELNEIEGWLRSKQAA